MRLQPCKGRFDRTSVFDGRYLRGRVCPRRIACDPARPLGRAVFVAIVKVFMKNIAIASLVAAAAFGAAAQAPAPAAFELKGYALGADLAACPAGFKTARDGALIQCQSTSETLAGKPIKGFVIYTYRGKVAGIVAGGIESPIDISNALKVKFGLPAESKPHIDEYTWNKGRTIMRVTSRAVLLKDFAMFDEAKAEDAKAAQSDI